ncbi:hypothetical protein B0H13DRAFT_2411763, partial [Mycena leptocephala]
YWAELETIRDARKCWDGVVHKLETRIERNPSDPLASQILDRILALPWYSGLRGFQERAVEGLANFCKPMAWFKTAEINQMLELLDDEDIELRSRGIRVIPSDYTRDIVRVYRNEGLEYDVSPRYRKIRELGEDFAKDRGKELATIANVDEDHWVTLIVDFTSETVYYFDSAKRPINAELREAYNWWIDQHHSTEFGWVALPCPQQIDSYNCGLFAANRVAHYIDPKKYPLLNPQACDDERLHVLAKILDRHESK